jgi:hypothetical protein
MKALARDLGNSQGEKLNPRRSRWQLTALIQKPKPQKTIMSFSYLSNICAYLFSLPIES